MENVLLVQCTDLGWPPFAGVTGRLMNCLGLVPKVIVRPLGLASLAAALKAKGHACEILDLNTCSASERRSILIKKIRAKHFAFIGFSFFTHGYPTALKYAEVCKTNSSASEVVFGGPHASFSYKESLSQPFVDFVICGEGEVSFPGLVSGENPRSIAGLALRDGDKVQNNHPVTIGNLDDLPLPDRAACQSLRYPYAPIDYVQTSRGCPKRCSFCVEARIFDKIRFRDPRATADEIKSLAKKGKRLIYLADSNFSASPGHVESICQEIRKSKPNVDLFAEMSIEFTDREMLKVLAKSSFTGVSFGVESLQRQSLAKIGKTTNGDAYRSKCLDLLTCCKEIGLKSSSYYIIPLPYQDGPSVREDIRQLHKFGQVELMLLTPFPGTRLWESAESSLLTRDYAKFDSYHIVYNPTSMTESEIASIYRDVVRRNRTLYTEAEAKELRRAAPV
ncbi:MAG: radical SAM protein [Syntrophales bacterium]|nr:radical SAM protein [Syntrophales bacterium]